MLTCLQLTAPHSASHPGLFPHHHLTSALPPTSSSSVMLQAHPFHLSMSGSELSISCWGALGPGGLNLPSLWFTLSCSANTLKWFYVTWSISPVAGCLLEKGPSNCGWHLLKQTGLRYRAGNRAPNRTLFPLLCQFFRAPQRTWRPRMCPCRDLCGTRGQPQLWSIFLGHSCLFTSCKPSDALGCGLV